MSDADTGTLGWVKAEIDGTIAEARACLGADVAADDTPLRMLANHVHQLVGTLQMIDLSGPALFAAEAEALVDHLRRGSPDPATAALLDQLFATLSDYLGALERGAPDMPLAHLELLNGVRAARAAKALDPADLFAVDLEVYPPGQRVSGQGSDADYRLDVMRLHVGYHSQLEAVLAGSGETVVPSGLAQVLDQLLESARLSGAAQLWWVGRAYLEWLGSEANALDVEAKQILTELDEKIGEVGEKGEAALVQTRPEGLLKRMLYRLATASTPEPRVAEVKSAFHLERLLGGETTVASEVLTRDALEALPEAFVAAVASSQQELARYFEAESTAAGLERLRTDLELMLKHAEAAGVDPVAGLIGETLAVVVALQRGVPMDPEQASMDLAASLLFIDRTLHSDRRLDADWADQVEARANRLRALTNGSASAVGARAAPGIGRHEFREILTVVSREVRSELAHVKAALEALAAGPASVEPRADVSAAMARVRGVLQMLAHDQVAELAGMVQRRFEAIYGSSGTASTAVVDALAVALTALEGHLEDLPHRLGQADARIDIAIQDLRAAERQPASGSDEILAIFAQELESRVAVLEQAISRCKQCAGDCRVTEELKRAVHTVAGSARAVNLPELADAYQASALVLDGALQRDELLRTAQLAPLDQLAALSRRAVRDLKSKRVLSRSLVGSLLQLAHDAGVAITRQAGADEATSLPPEGADFLGIFIDEASDALTRVEYALGEWRTGQEPGTVLPGLRRELHTLKGSARAVGVEVMGELSHSTETLLDRIGASASEFEPTRLLELLEEVHDALASAVAQLRKGEAPVPTPLLTAKLKRFPQEPVTEGLEPQATALRDAAPAASDANAALGVPLPRSQVRISPALLDRLVNYAGEISITRARVQEQFKLLKQHLQDLRRHLGRFRDQLRELELHAEDEIRVHREDQEPAARIKDFDPLEFDRYTKLQQLSRSLVESMDAMATVNTSMSRVTHDSESVLQEQGHLSSELHSSLLRARMVPFGTVVPRLRHQLRHTAGEVNKQVELEVLGEDVGIDRTILESMTEAFTHMIRNALDHGIETREQRVAAGKPPVGRVRIECTLKGNEVCLQFSDDGRGLDLNAIRARAIARGLIDAETPLNGQDLLQLIVAPGFSTVDAVTELSGRGVGMDVVHSAVRRLGGTLTVHSEAQEGTTFSMHLPVSLAMTQAVFVHCGAHYFAISLRAVEAIAEVPRSSLMSDETTGELLLVHDDHRYPLMHLTQRFGLACTKPVSDNVPILLARMGATHVAVQVDELVGTQEIVIKKLGSHLAGLEGVTGAAVRSDGRPILVLDVVDLWVSEKAANSNRSSTEDGGTAHPPLVMVVDDSFTVRKVTSRNLTRHGMRVVTAKDGVDALEQIKAQLPDIMLIDIEMPRMDGYELTDRIRAHPATKAIPIIMVTSRAGQKHRHRALQLGADAFITKPYHEDELVQEVRRLLGSVEEESA